MRILLCVLLFAPLILKAQADTTVGVKFEKGLSWEQVKAKAKDENKYIFVDCYATWCAPCKMMDSDVYPEVHVGYEMNENFIPVKLQMDKTDSDNVEVKNWYNEAGRIARDYKVESLPAFLFFNPNGKLVHKADGYQKPIDFIRLLQLARDPQKEIFYTEYENYKNGKRNFKTLGNLARFTRDLIGDESAARKMAKEYNGHYLNKLQPNNLYTSENIKFIYSFRTIANSKDKLFKLAYDSPKRFDSLRGGPGGAAKVLVEETITRENLEDKVLKKGKAITRIPDWNKLQSNIAKKYTKIDAKKIVLTFKIKYYKDLYVDWSLWAKYKDEMIEKYLPKIPDEFELYTEINGYGGAWYAFLHCQDTIILKKALEWVDLALRLGSEGQNNAAYLDTKANLLYKLGRKDEAIPMERKALDLVLKSVPEAAGEFKTAYEKMLKGESTWENSIPDASN